MQYCTTAISSLLSVLLFHCAVLEVLYSTHCTAVYFTQNATCTCVLYSNALKCTSCHNVLFDSRSSGDGIFFALLEWLILSQSSLIVNTYGSSFAMEAAAVKQAILVGIWGGHLIHHSDKHLPFCGHMQFMKAYSQQQVPMVSYTEGTTDRRTLKSKALKVKICVHLQEWGLPEVLCVPTDEEAESI